MSKKSGIVVSILSIAAVLISVAALVICLNTAGKSSEKRTGNGLRQGAVLPGWCLYHYGSESWSGF